MWHRLSRLHWQTRDANRPLLPQSALAALEHGPMRGRAEAAPWLCCVAVRLCARCPARVRAAHVAGKLAAGLPPPAALAVWAAAGAALSEAMPAAGPGPLGGQALAETLQRLAVAEGLAAAALRAGETRAARATLSRWLAGCGPSCCMQGTAPDPHCGRRVREAEIARACKALRKPCMRAPGRPRRLPSRLQAPGAACSYNSETGGAGSLGCDDAAPVTCGAGARRATPCCWRASTGRRSRCWSRSGRVRTRAPRSLRATQVPPSAALLVAGNAARLGEACHGRPAEAPRAGCRPPAAAARPVPPCCAEARCGETRADAGECAGNLQRAAACAAALPAGPGACAAPAAALRALAFLRRHAAPDAAAAARLAARAHAHGRAGSPGARTCGGPAGDAAAPAAMAAALEAAPVLMAAAAAAEAAAGAVAEGGASATDRHAYGVASALVAAAQVRAAAALAGLERGGGAAAPVCEASAFECLWPALDESLAGGCAAAARACPKTWELRHGISAACRYER
jgi:hypothetical protein